MQMPEVDEERLRSELVRLLDPQPGGRGKIPASTDADNCPELIGYVRGVLSSDNYSASRTAWALVVEALGASDNPEAETRPIAAGRFLLARAEWDEMRRVSADYWRRKNKPEYEGRLDFENLAIGKGLRQRYANVAGRFADPDTRWALTSTDRRSAENFRVITSALWLQIQAVCADQNRLLAIAVPLQPDDEDQTDPPRDETQTEPVEVGSGDASLAPAQGKQLGVRSKRRRGLAVGLVAGAVAVLVIGLSAIFWPWGWGGSANVGITDEPVALAEQSWGPARDAVSINGRTPAVALNSVIDNPDYGDERNFFQVRPVDETVSYSDTASIEPGQAYEGRIYFDNNSRETEAEDVRLRLLLPDVVSGSGVALATLSSSNADPGLIWDSIVVALPDSQQHAYIRVVPDSAILHVGTALDGSVLDDDALLGEAGAMLGCDTLDGSLSPGLDCAGYVTFQFSVTEADASLTVASRIKDADTEGYSGSLAVSPGEVVQMRLEFANTGDVQQNNVVVRVSDLPDGVRYLDGSTELKNGNHPDWKRVSDNLVGTGINIGDYLTGANAFVRFDVMIDPDFPGAPGWLQMLPFATLQVGNEQQTVDLTLLVR